MARKLTLALALILSMLTAREASAVPLVEVNLDLFYGSLGSPDFPIIEDDFTEEMGDIRNKVWQVDLGGGPLYLYVHKVDPAVDPGEFITEFHTVFDVAGFDLGGFGIAGWSFEDAADAGGNGDDTDFLTSHSPLTGQLFWDNPPSFAWQNDPIKFFFISTRPPGLGLYALHDNTPDTGTAQSYAPTPEPGSMMLLGSGLAALYGAARRRKAQKDLAVTELAA